MLTAFVCYYQPRCEAARSGGTRLSFKKHHEVKRLPINFGHNTGFDVSRKVLAGPVISGMSITRPR